MKISSRIRNITPSATVAITGRVAALKKEGVNVINFGVGEPDFATPDHVGEAGKAAIDQHKTHYTAVAGILELRQAICKKLRESSTHISPNSPATAAATVADAFPSPTPTLPKRYTA